MLHGMIPRLRYDSLATARLFPMPMDLFLFGRLGFAQVLALPCSQLVRSNWHIIGNPSKNSDTLVVGGPGFFN